MKELQNIVGAKALNKKEQEAVKGGLKIIPISPCGTGGGVVLTRYTSAESCDGHGIWAGNQCWSCY